MLTAFQTGALTESIDRAGYREFRRRTAGPRRLWPRVVGLLGSCALIVFLSLYVTEFDLSLAPWFAIGIAALFALSWELVRRGASKRQRLRYRLDRFAPDNGCRIEHDVAEPDTVGLLFRLGTKPVTVVRLSRSSAEGSFSVGIHARTEPTPTGGTAVVETVYVCGARPAAPPGAPPHAAPSVSPATPGAPSTHVMPTTASVLPATAALPESASPPGHPMAMESASSTSSPPPAPNASTVVAGLENLPAAGIGIGDDATPFRYEELGESTICYLEGAVDLADPRSWARISAVLGWIQSPRP